MYVEKSSVDIAEKMGPAIYLIFVSRDKSCIEVYDFTSAKAFESTLKIRCFSFQELSLMRVTH